MAQAADQVADQSRPAVRTRPQLALDFNTDRAQAFRRARVHTGIVRVLRIALPVTAVAMFASYGIFVQRSVKISKAKGHISIDSASISTEALIAHNPKYEGFDKQGGKFVVHALTAEQDFGQKGPVRLKTIDGQMIDANKSVTDLKARTGTLDTKTNVMELYEKIDVVSQNGMTAELTRATVYTKESRITSDEPVIVRLPTGVVRGKAMVIEQKKRQITFSKGVVAHLRQETSKDKLAAGAAAAKTAVAGKAGAGKAPDGAPFGASDAPVDITASKLFIDDNAKLAVFSGNVVAVQNDATLHTAELEVSYEGQAGGDSSNGTSKPAATDPAASSKVKRLVSRTDVVLTRGIERATGRSAEFEAATDRATLVGDVVITSGPDRQATSDRADMDNKSDTALLTGNVVVTQLKNVLKGRRLFLDRKAGTMQMSAPAEPAGLGVPAVPKGRITARMYQAENEAATAAKTAGAAPAADAAKGAVSAMTLRSDPSQPIDIDADTLDVNDRVKTATFRGAVHAVQGDYTIRTEELVAFYSGESGMALGQPTGDAKAGDAKAGDAKAKGSPHQQAGAQPASGTQLQKVQATRRVIVTTKDGRTVTGNTAEFDTKANKITVVGDVVMSENNHSTGTLPRVAFDMTTGKMIVEQPTAAQTVAGSPPPQRAQLLIYPKDAKDKKAAPPAASAAAAAPSAPAAVPELPGASQARPPQRGTGWSNQSDPFERFGQ